MVEHDDTTNGPEEAEAPPRKRWRFPWKSAIAVAIIVLIALPIISVLQPAYYERYPELGPRMENWRTSTHAKISCSECHIEPGARGFVTFAAKSIPAYYSQLIQGPDTTNLLSTPDRDACQKCHTSYRQVSSNGDLLIPHRAHVEVLEIDCATCHEDLVHTANEAGYNAPTMIGCLENCHDGEQASAECTDCHTRKHVPDDHKRDDWLEVHAGHSEEIDCDECHGWSPDYCADCHAERPASHAGNWKKDHQYPALERGETPCRTCHDEAFCKDCHD